MGYKKCAGERKIKPAHEPPCGYKWISATKVLLIFDICKYFGENLAK